MKDPHFVLAPSLVLLIPYSSEVQTQDQSREHLTGQSQPLINEARIAESRVDKLQTDPEFQGKYSLGKGNKNSPGLKK